VHLADIWVSPALGGIKIGWGARIRTWEWRNQNPLPYRLATPQNKKRGKAAISRLYTVVLTIIQGSE
jgi:hypothetical protein